MATLDRARLLLTANDPRSAVQVLEALGPPGELKTDALLLLIQACYHEMGFRRVIALCDVMSSRPDANPEFHFWLGNARLGMWQASQAEAAFKECLRRDVHQEGATLQLAKLYATQARRQEVEPLILELYSRGKSPPPEKAASFDPGDRILEPNLLVQLLIIQYFGWEAAAMIDQLRLFHEADPDDFEAQVALALACIRTDNHIEAWDLLRDCTRRRPDHPRAAAALLECALAMNDLEACRQWLGTHPDDFTDDAQVWDLRGQILLSDAQHERAADCFRRAVEIDPYLSQAQYRLGRCLMAAGNRLEAADRIEIGRQLNLASAELLKTVSAMQSVQPTAPQCLQLARLCYRLGKRRIATEWLKLAKAFGSAAADVLQLQTEMTRNPSGPIVGATHE